MGTGYPARMVHGGGGWSDPAPFLFEEEMEDSFFTAPVYCPRCNVVMTIDERDLLHLCIECYYRESQDKANKAWKEKNARSCQHS